MRLRSLIVNNYCCIGERGYEIEIDKIIVLIGPNNVGKSSILDAYEAFASIGAEIPIEKFRDENPANVIRITGIFVDLSEEDIRILGQKWRHADIKYGDCIKVKWEWTQPDQKGTKYSWDPTISNWVEGGVGGWDTLIKSRIPAPIRVRPTDDASTTEEQIAEILTSAAKRMIKQDHTKAASVLAELQRLTTEFASEIRQDITNATDRITARLSSVFPGYRVVFEPGIGKVEPEKIIGAGSYIKIESPGRNQRALFQEGAGLRRTFLWTALGALADLGRAKLGKTIISTDRPRILLIEEPESFLHPPLIKAAREALYEISTLDDWQVIATTHSPIFIDVSKPHTTIIRVAKDEGEGIRLFSTDRAAFDVPDREQLMMIRACHPTINEFFFADQSWLVEGETEHSVLTALLLRSDNPRRNNICIVNCLGKANLPLFARILNQFGTPYTVIHDSDSPKASRNGRLIRNSMWTINQSIQQVVSQRNVALPPALLVVHFPDFEGYYFGEKLIDDKPYSAIQHISSPEFQSSPDYESLRNLIAQLLTSSHPNSYRNEAEYYSLYRTWIGRENPQPPDKWQV